MWTIGIIKVLVFGYSRLTIDIFNLLHDLLSPREPSESFDSLYPTSSFQIKSSLDAFTRIGCADL